MKYVRYSASKLPSEGVSYGILDGATVRELRGDLFSNRETGVVRKLSEVKLLHPIQPGKILAVGRNYKSHLGDHQLPERPEIFIKSISSLQDPEEPIIYPADSKNNVHYEGELVLVIGTHLKKASLETARAGIWGVTIGNDVSERDWQRGPDKDMQWWRGKSADTFGPLGPCIVTGLDYGNLKLETRVNGTPVQQDNTNMLIFDCPTIVSFISQYMTLERGDLVFTGTPNITSRMNPGDVCEVEIEGIGVLRNPIVKEA
jgi:2-keto-4-pentenoate hydratase/2-oxohepta-3-ene-1,7-dioic acid hydratase in catechol pathway